MFKLSVLLLGLASLASCGGDSGSDDYQMAVDQASAKKAEAVALAPASPCNAVAQCANLAFVVPNGHCFAATYQPYSLASPTASAASAAAAEQRTLGQHAVSVAPPPAMSCTAAIAAPPALACVANTCQAAATP
jgi:hypothetical protein